MGPTFKLCPDLIGWEERSAISIGSTWDKVRIPILKECVGSKCAAYKCGVCTKYDTVVYYDSEPVEEVEED